MAGEFSLPSVSFSLMMPLVLGTAVYSIMWAVSAPGIVPAAFLKKSGYELALTCIAAPVFLMVIMVMTVGFTRLLTGTGDPTKARTNRMLQASSMAVKNHFEQTFLFAINLIGYSLHGNAETVVLFAAIYTITRFGYWFGYLMYAACDVTHLRLFVSYGILMTTFMMYENGRWICGCGSN
jgi:uncharacterized MAPEG superfamily protein